MESGNVMKWPELTPAEIYVDILDTIDLLLKFGSSYE